MALDGVMLKAIADELRRELASARIDRVMQPERDEIHLLLRLPGRNLRLLLSAQPEQARMHLVKEAKPNPSSAPLFCMVLRKHLEGGRIAGIEQPRLDRLLRINIESTNELGDPVKRTLVCEIMGKHSNIILLDTDTNQIIDGIRRYSHSLSRYREVLPDRPYLAPPDQGKKDLMSLDLSGNTLTRMLLDKPWHTLVWRAVFELIEGLSPLLAKELVVRSGLAYHSTLEECGDYDFNRLHQSLRWLQEVLRIGAYEPNLVIRNTPDGREMSLNTQVVEFSAVPLKQYEGEEYLVVNYHSPSELLESYYRIRRLQSRWRESYQELARTLQNSLEKAYSKLGLREDSLKQIRRAEEYKHLGDLVMTYLYMIEPGMEEIRVPDLTDGREIIIPLAPLLSPVQNAQEYYRRYGKARRSLNTVKHYWELSRQEVGYLESVSQSLTMAGTLQELQEIKDELSEQGYLRRRAAPGKARKDKKPGRKDAVKKEKEPNLSPTRFLSSDGCEIYVGKNNRQNDFVTMKLARKGDIWLHAKDMPGAHVIIRTRTKSESDNAGTVPTRTLEEAAQLAAYFSRGRHSSSVNVDYTLRRYVRKPGGAPPGYVIYDHYRTLLVKPLIPGTVTEERKPE